MSKKRNKSELPSANWTTRELRSFIRAETKELNDKYAAYEQNVGELKENSPLMYQQRNKLLELSGVKERHGKIGLGLATKVKPDLVAQARALVEAKRGEFIDIAKTEEYSKRLESFNSTTGLDLSMEEYQDFGEVLESFGSHVASFQQTSDFIRAVGSAIKRGKSAKEVRSAVYELGREVKNSGGIDMKTAINNLEDKLFK